MSYHTDSETNLALIKLLDALCSWERHTGRGSTLILIPYSRDEELVIAQDGKPLQIGIPSKERDLQLIFRLALRRRGIPEKEEDEEE